MRTQLPMLVFADDEAMARQLDAELNAGGRRTRHQQQHQHMAVDDEEWDDDQVGILRRTKRSSAGFERAFDCLEQATAMRKMALVKFVAI